MKSVENKGRQVLSASAGTESKRLSTLGRSPTVGLLIDCIKEGYQWAVLRGAIDGALDGGAHLLCFAGGILEAGRGEGGERNSVFDLVRPSTVDALVVASGAIGNRIDSEQLEKYCERFRPLPMCSIALELAGMSSVCIDNASGMYAVVEHLGRVHGMKRIAFVEGPATNADASRRFAAFAAALEKQGLALVPELVVPGDFEEASGRQAVRVLLDERKISVHALDAIVAANDAMALGVIAELTLRGVRVPDQVAVVGFDDVDESSLALPPLTTVRQPLYEQGRDAVRLVLRQLRLGAPAERVIRRAELVVRQSCRCLGQHNEVDAADSGVAGTPLGFEAAFVGRKPLILAAVTRSARGQLGAAGSDWGERLLSTFAEQLRTRDAETFVQCYDDLLRRLSATDVELSVCNDVITALRGAVLPCLDADPKRRGRAEAMFQDVRIMTADGMRRGQAWRRIRAEARAAALGRAAAAIASVRDRDELASAVAAHLPAMGVARCHLVVYGDDGVGASSASRLVIHQRPDARSTDRYSGVLTPLADILRRDVLPTTGEHAFAVLPIAFDGKDAGVLIVELGAPAGYLYEVLRDVFTAALQVAGRPTIDRVA